MTATAISMKITMQVRTAASSGYVLRAVLITTIEMESAVNLELFALHGAFYVMIVTNSW